MACFPTSARRSPLSTQKAPSNWRPSVKLRQQNAPTPTPLNSGSHSCSAVKRLSASGLLDYRQNIAGWIGEPRDVGAVATHDASRILGESVVFQKLHATCGQLIDGCVD